MNAQNWFSLLTELVGSTGVREDSPMKAPEYIKLFRPVNDLCLDCGHNIQPCNERNYIVWDGTYDNGRHPSGKRRIKGNYRRQCATCYDKEHHRSYERRTSRDGVMFTFEPDRGPGTIA